MSHTDEKRSQNTTEEVRAELSKRIAGYRFLLVEYHTPLFRNELLDAIKMNEEALKSPDPTPAERERVFDQLGVLDKMDDRLQKHWGELQKSMSSRTVLLANISNFQRYLGAWLILDYAGKHAGKRYPWASDLVKRIDEVGSGVSSFDQDFKRHQQTFVRPLKEMMLNQDHVERRVRAAAAGSTHPTGEIHLLIDQCDWQNLAASVVNDRELAVALFDATPIIPECWSAEFGKSVMLLIDGIRDKYFTELSTPTEYTLSKRARDLSAKKTARADRQSSSTPPSPDSVGNAEESSAVAAAKSVYNKVVSGLGLGRTGSSLRSIAHRRTSTASPGPSLDSTTQLIGSEEKAS